MTFIGFNDAAIKKFQHGRNTISTWLPPARDKDLTHFVTSDNVILTDRRLDNYMLLHGCPQNEINYFYDIVYVDTAKAETILHETAGQNNREWKQQRKVSFKLHK